MQLQRGPVVQSANNSTVKTIALLLSLVSVLPVCGQDGPDGGGRDGGRDKGKSKHRSPKFDLIKRYDVDKDLKLSRAEFDQGERAKKLEEAVRAALFARLDKNGDGFITRDELPKMPGPPDGLHWIGKSDLNRDGRVSFEEFAKSSRFKDASTERLKAMFDHFDRNKDGFLDAKDHPERRRDHRRPMPRIALEKLDSNKDGELTWEEFKDAPPLLHLEEGDRKRLFARLDSDKNGSVSGEELMNASHDRERKGGGDRKGERGPEKGRKGPKK